MYACVLYKGQYFTELPKYEMWKGNGEGPYCLYVEKCMIHFRERDREREREREREVAFCYMPLLSNILQFKDI